MGIGRVKQQGFEMQLKLQGHTVFVHKNFGKSDMDSFETCAWKNFNDQDKRQVVFKFAKQEEIYADMVVQVKGARDFWKVTDTEDIIEDNTFICMEVLVVKINEQGNHTRLNNEGKAVFTGNVYGGVMIDGKNNTQTNTVNVNSDFTEAIDKLLNLIENSSLNPIQKIETKSNVQIIKQLAVLDKSPEVLEVATSKIEAVKEVISMTADMTSLGMVLVPILQAAFGS
ncbi:MAG: hypothetical protein WKF90_12270 [Pyrinomonadaceae bacterium]